MTHPVVLVDEWDDGHIENTAWVEVYSSKSDRGVRTANGAVEVIEKMYPLEDRAEEDFYYCDGERVWMAPDGEPQGDGQFIQRHSQRDGDFSVYEWPEVPWCATERKGEKMALRFWVVCVGVKS